MRRVCTLIQRCRPGCIATGTSTGAPLRCPVDVRGQSIVSSRGAEGGQTRNGDAAPALPDIVAVEAVRAIAERNPRRRIGPSNLPTRAAVTERVRRISLTEAAIVRHAVVARNNHTKHAVALVLADRIEIVAG